MTFKTFTISALAAIGMMGATAGTSFALVCDEYPTPRPDDCRLLETQAMAQSETPKPICELGGSLLNKNNNSGKTCEDILLQRKLNSPEHKMCDPDLSHCSSL